MSEAKTVCLFCERPPGGVHKEDCQRGSLFARERKEPEKVTVTIDDLVAGPFKKAKLAADDQRIELDAEAAANFVEVLQNPPEPNDALVAAAEAYKSAVEQGKD